MHMFSSLRPQQSTPLAAQLLKSKKKRTPIDDGKHFAFSSIIPKNSSKVLPSFQLQNFYVHLIEKNVSMLSSTSSFE